jgi:hypothetical protein
MPDNTQIIFIDQQRAEGMVTMRAGGEGDGAMEQGQVNGLHGLILLNFQRFKNDTHDPIQVFLHFVVPKTQNPIAFCLKEYRAFVVVCGLFQVMAAIQFNDEFFTRGTKVNDVIANSVLSSEMDSLGLMRTQNLPKFGFGFSLVVTQFLGIGKDFWGGTAVGHTPSWPPPNSKTGNLGEENYWTNSKNCFLKFKLFLLPPNPGLIWGKAGKGVKSFYPGYQTTRGSSTARR